MSPPSRQQVAPTRLTQYRSANVVISSAIPVLDPATLFGNTEIAAGQPMWAAFRIGDACFSDG